MNSALILTGHIMLATASGFGGFANRMVLKSLMHNYRWENILEQLNLALKASDYSQLIDSKIYNISFTM